MERYVENYFKKLGNNNIDFQSEIRVGNGLFTRVDALEKKKDRKIILYEIKSSTSVKSDAKQNHYKDACFQKICVEATGQKIDRVFLIHLNPDYVRDGEIDPIKLLKFSDVTTKIENITDETKEEISSAIDLLNQAEIDIHGCSCMYKSSANHCDTFSLFNPNIKKPSIYELPRLSPEKRKELVNNGTLSLLDLPENYDLSTNQEIILQAAKSNIPQINHEAIKSFLSSLKFPLYFLDYETYMSGIPLINYIKPYEHFPIQYSLHKLCADGSLSHKEYLEPEARLPDHLLSRLKSHIGNQGNILSWHASFEKTINNNVARVFPEDALFLNDLNERTVDMEKVFKTDYVDARFEGSTSIKKVLPVLCPQLSYSDLDIQNGPSAMEAWQKMLNCEPNEAKHIAHSLLSYCKLDTFAMVEIYRFLTRL